MLLAQVQAQKFAIYLYKNNHLTDFKIEKENARKLYTDFREKHKTKINFGSLFYHGLKLLRRQPDLSVMFYKETRLMTLMKKESKLDEVLREKSGVRKNTMVSHSFSFNKNKRSENDVLLSPQECKLCDVKFEDTKNFEEHVSKEEHGFFEKLNDALKSKKKSHDLHFTINGSPELNNLILRKNTPKIFSLNVTNSTKQPITIRSVQSNQNSETVEFNALSPQLLAPSASINYSLTVNFKDERVLYYPIIFSTEVNKEKKQEVIELVFHAHDEFFDDLHPVVPYKRITKPVIKEYIENIDAGEPPKAFGSVKAKVPLPRYLLPVDLSIILNAGLKNFEGISKSQRERLADIEDLLKVENKLRPLTHMNYTKLLDLLLFIEEHQMLKDIRDYDRENQISKKNGDLFELEVPGLSEHRPSVIVGDAVYLRENKQSSTLYQGFVHRVQESSVLLKFSKKFTNAIYIKGKKFYVSFSFNRYPLRVEHQAVEIIKMANTAHLLFPKLVVNNPIQNTDLVWFNRDIVNNPEQQQAVRAVLKKSSMPSPYLIFGPPGTGKTMTVVEAVKQIHKRTSERVLICTPSNSAANEVTKRLISIPTTDMFRLVASSFPYQQIPEEIRKYVNATAGDYYFAEWSNLMKYRILITTLTSAAKLISGGCPTNHFSYVFVDEAGQATETETLIPIAGILSNSSQHGIISGQVVLAGDPRQLGPIIHSTLTKEYGFGTSMLERLMDQSEPYKKHSNIYNPNALTKLLKNYRSHPVIMNQSNRLFYDNELQTAGDHLINVALNWEGLPNRQFPMIFHNVIGVDQREGNSPSFFNVQEVQVTLDYLSRLIGTKMQGMVIKENHIGIISPYKKQVEKIRVACKKKKYNNDLLIGTVEQIQGQEKLIIIISTVRSKSELLKFDYKFHLGFLDNPKRFNVAVTRAKALLIVVGNPNILQFDKHWRSLMVYCKENKAMVGEKFDFSKSSESEESSDAQNDEAKYEETPSFSRGIL